MINIDTFVTILYVMSDDFCQSQLREEPDRPGPHARLSRAEVITLAVFGQWVNFLKSSGPFTARPRIT